MGPDSKLPVSIFSIEFAPSTIETTTHDSRNEFLLSDNCERRVGTNSADLGSAGSVPTTCPKLTADQTELSEYTPEAPPILVVTATRIQGESSVPDMTEGELQGFGILVTAPTLASGLQVTSRRQQSVVAAVPFG